VLASKRLDPAYAVTSLDSNSVIWRFVLQRFGRCRRGTGSIVCASAGVGTSKERFETSPSVDGLSLEMDV